MPFRHSSTINTETPLGSRPCGVSNHSRYWRTIMAVSNSTSSRFTDYPEYPIWKQMRRRCSIPTHPKYHLYGARGIRVCDRWNDSFVAFYADMGPRPSPAHSIDRIDNNGHYTANNCRWATRQQQGRNTRRNRLLTLDGRTMCVQDWSDETGIHTRTIRTRLDRGWSIERALTTPARHRST